MKSYTDLYQSKKLAEFLPIESADCYWDYDGLQKYHHISWFEEGFNKESQLRLNENNVCAWSLAALLGVTRKYCTRFELTLRANKKYNLFAMTDNFVYRGFNEYPDGINNPIDACVALIEKIYELKLL